MTTGAYIASAIVRLLPKRYGPPVALAVQRDDICSPGQPLAAQDLCPRIKPSLRAHDVQPGVGHHGMFGGRRWQRHIYPLVRNVTQVSRWQ